MARILALVSICFVLGGCELLADFDRSKIPPSDAGMKPPTADGGNEADAGEEDGG